LCAWLLHLFPLKLGTGGDDLDRRAAPGPGRPSEPTRLDVYTSKFASYASPFGLSRVAARALPEMIPWPGLSIRTLIGMVGWSTVPRGQHMRISIDMDTCQGHGRCSLVAPELFDVDDDGKALLLVEGDILTASESDARLAAANCPERAITIIE
jgi:ferredoxin